MEVKRKSETAFDWNVRNMLDFISRQLNERKISVHFGRRRPRGSRGETPLGCSN